MRERECKCVCVFERECVCGSEEKAAVFAAQYVSRENTQSVLS